MVSKTERQREGEGGSEEWREGEKRGKGGESEGRREEEG